MVEGLSFANSRRYNTFGDALGAFRVAVRDGHLVPLSGAMDI